LNKLPEVKAWIEEADQYPNVKVEYDSGDPRFYFYDANGKQIGNEKPVANLTKDDIHNLLEMMGLTRNH